jgi:hypothetical protein
LKHGESGAQSVVVALSSGTPRTSSATEKRPTCSPFRAPIVVARRRLVVPIARASSSSSRCSRGRTTPSVILPAFAIGATPEVMASRVSCGSFRPSHVWIDGEPLTVSLELRREGYRSRASTASTALRRAGGFFLWKSLQGTGSADDCLVTGSCCTLEYRAEG